jgi:hypothetical protein
MMISLLYSLFICCLLSSLVVADVPSPSHTFNVTLPEPNAPYVAGQMLPISYTLPDDTNLPNCKYNNELKYTRLIFGQCFHYLCISLHRILLLTLVILSSRLMRIFHKDSALEELIIPLCIMSIN